MASMTQSVWLLHEIQKHWVRIPVESDVCHRGCAYTVLQTVKMDGVYSAVNGNGHYKELF